MVQKILRILAKTILGLFLFYLITGFVIIPLALRWAITSQGTKILKHPVHLHSVAFNPILWHLTMGDFEILDDRNQVMLGFDKLFVDISFIELLKKIYHVKVFELDGLKVNAELLPGNRINLMELVGPNMDQPAGRASMKGSKQPITNTVKPAPIGPIPSKSIPAALPAVIIDTIVLHQGDLQFKDITVNPNFSMSLSGIEVTVTNVTTKPGGQAVIDFHANLDDKGKVSMHTVIEPLATPLTMETTFRLNDYALRVLTPYTGKYTGRELKSGKLDLRMDYRIGENKLVASHRILIQHFEFGNNVQSPDALHLPFGLAVALLEDAQGRIKIVLPVSGDMSNPKFEYTHLIFQVLHNFFLNIVTKPFSFLASSLGAPGTGTEELGYVRFSPGRAALTVGEQQKLFILIKGLYEHPRLHLEIDGSYDPQLDWKAIQAETFMKDFEQLRKISSGPESKVYQLLYQRHFGLRALWALAKKYKKGWGSYDDAKLDQEIRRQMIENAPPDLEALNVLAGSRARLVHDFLVINGFDAHRLGLGPSQSTQGAMGFIPTQLTLTVFDQ